MRRNCGLRIAGCGFAEARNRRADLKSEIRNPQVHCSGFTLVEVLATIVLIGIIVPVAMQGVSSAVQAAAQARHTTEAASLADHKLSELVTTRTWSSVGAAGDFGEEWPEYHWNCQSEQRSDLGVTEVVVAVTWTQRNVERSVKVSTLVYEADTTSTIGGLP